jgi:hypothetical protein
VFRKNGAGGRRNTPGGNATAARLTSRATGLDFEFAAILVNVIAGALAAVCLFTLVSRFADRAAALLVSAALTRGATVPLSAAALWAWGYAPDLTETVSRCRPS